MTSLLAVVFDLDGTLCESTQDGADLYAAAFESAGLDPFGAVGDLWASLEGPPDTSNEQSYLAAGFRRLAAQHGHRRVPADDLASGLLAAVDRSAVAFREGAETALEAALAHGPVGVLTNGPSHRQEPKIATLALADRVGTVCYAGDLERRKPHPEPFESVCATLGVEHDRTLYVGDSLAYDVAGAHAAGLQAAWCPRTPGETNGYQPEYVFDRIDDLVAVLEGEREGPGP
ncbi:HAD family hydrolase [Halomicroarcula sp. GCM10025324]|uniref:HAD family hydrolase n=1 Tax=Haloarcula TaxID=2237 RepID=UPI0023E7DD93|nr:HAD family hydrolase [Halomicroarcula sp. ZS-22-S1]